MAIAKLKLLEIEFPAQQYDAVLLKLINLDNFHPEPASKFADSVQGLSVLNRENPYADLIARMEEARDKYRLQLNNTVGIIDSDYFNSDNEGHIFIKITNDSNENKTVELNAGQGFAQGIFMPFGLVEDDDTTDQRNGGFGSTTK